ncbi:hypothetical protein BH10PSE19_BH10PSE19_06580 [soil metagenome]
MKKVLLGWSAFLSLTASVACFATNIIIENNLSFLNKNYSLEPVTIFNPKPQKSTLEYQEALEFTPENSPTILDATTVVNKATGYVLGSFKIVQKNEKLEIETTKCRSEKSLAQDDCLFRIEKGDNPYYFLLTVEKKISVPGKK